MPGNLLIIWCSWRVVKLYFSSTYISGSMAKLASFPASSITLPSVVVIPLPSSCFSKASTSWILFSGFAPEGIFASGAFTAVVWSVWYQIRLVHLFFGVSPIGVINRILIELIALCQTNPSEDVLLAKNTHVLLAWRRS